MKALLYSSVVLLLACISLPATADAFSRRSSHSEVTQSQSVTTPIRINTTETGNVSAQAVPEPPVLFLMSIGLGVFGLAAAIKKSQKQW